MKNFEAASKPLVSIILPTLNSRRFLRERIDSIIFQTLTNWELIVVDSSSSDGTVDYIEDRFRGIKKIRIFNRPRGLYEAWNFGITKATGKYIYIATSDDTMDLDALFKMSNALEENPSCGICDTQLVIINGEGQILEGVAERLPLRRLIGEQVANKIVRFAPFDAIVYCTGVTSITSMAQAMFRRDLFLTIGVFRSEFGPRGDFEWGLRATLSTNVIYIPEKLTTWRRHSQNATGQSSVMEHARTYAMFRAAIAATDSSARSFTNLPQFDKILVESDKHLKRRSVRDEIRSGTLLERLLSIGMVCVSEPFVLYELIIERWLRMDYSDIANYHLRRIDRNFGFIRALLEDGPGRGTAESELPLNNPTVTDA